MREHQQIDSMVSPITPEELLSILLGRLDRQSFGSENETATVIKTLGLDETTSYRIANLACGTGATTLQLAKHVQGTILGVDPSPQLLDRLVKRSAANSLKATIDVTSDYYNQLPIAPRSLDLLWSQDRGRETDFIPMIEYWNSLLKPGGMLVVTELIWTTHNPAGEVVEYWGSRYQDINTLEARLEELEAAGFDVLRGEFLPASCYEEHFYTPLSNEFESFMDEFPIPAAIGLVGQLKQEIKMYHKFKDHYGHAVLIAQKR